MTAPWKRPRALLVLEDGTVFKGYAFASAEQGRALGEVVFNTAMTGYQEVLTDPSYKGQIVTMTYPLTGNYGINDEDMESAAIQVEAFIIKEYQDFPSNWRSRKSLAQFLEEHRVLGIEGIDTRRLTRHIRLAGALRGVIATDTDDVGALLDQVRDFPGLKGVDMVRRVTCSRPYRWEKGPQPDAAWREDKPDFRVAALDFGVKYNILRNLERCGCQVLVFPATASPEEILATQPDGIFLSNGPGDPAAVTYGIETVRKLLGTKPMFGICLGHQLMGLALGGRTFKLKFGHRGANQPVKDLSTGRVEVTSQNHGFCVDLESMQDIPVRLTHINLNDNTLEGMEHLEMPAFSVQYHPEAAPGPHDATYLFERFVNLIRKDKGLQD
ncbi:carbamoyl-phosphate synthase small subunit [Desulfacinum hydrothermale DSM 13146]|uniref:Carbamoyl phosphate synthase small chain n=1 Tax=Desulfacinum hydrothermale DSM 13146 TaxID=1121390 RepID=A0A1W1XMV0_9BACT|nr:glutamine-hydrolyzing carbamoyl-phosphate synthase small subunit [Desulfacinum hydrothermale]SMC25175.1 carbamoyl-phosphate synthase small subunit [Desulfacinum hydrothermale DSM 13146]